MRLKTKVTLWATVTCSVLIVLTLYPLLDRPKAFPGYTLVAPVLSTKTHLMDMQGRDVYDVGEQLHRGRKSRTCSRMATCCGPASFPRMSDSLAGPQAGGRVQEFTWDGELVWDFKFHNEKQIPHHDLAKLPNGNVLLIVWEIKTAEETIAAGRSRESVDGPWLVDSIIEIKPTGKTTGEVVWEWHVWDHLIQDHDSSQRNYGDVSAHPELIDINFGQTLLSEVSRAGKSPEEEARRKNQLKTLNSIGYLGAPAAQGNPAIMPDWTHVNAVAYNADLDQIMLTVRAFSEFWIIDHSTTSAEAQATPEAEAGWAEIFSTAGETPRPIEPARSSISGSSPLMTRTGSRGACPGAGHVLVFNNGLGRPGSDYSSVDEIVLPLDAGGPIRPQTGDLRTGRTNRSGATPHQPRLTSPSG